MEPVGPARSAWLIPAFGVAVAVAVTLGLIGLVGGRFSAPLATPHSARGASGGGGGMLNIKNHLLSLSKCGPSKHCFYWRFYASAEK